MFVMFAYLFTTVGVQAITPVGPHLAPGGYLGVKANITLTMQCFVLVLQEVKCKLPSEVVGASLSWSRIGGDDFLILLQADSHGTLLVAETYVRQAITNYVGQLKEFTVDRFDTLGMQSRYATGQFCKKPFTITVTDSGPDTTFVILKSDQKLPLMGDLLRNLSAESSKEKVVRLVKFRSTMHRLLDGYDGCDQLVNAYCYAFCSVHNIPCEGSYELKSLQSGTSLLRNECGRLLMPNAYVLLCSTPHQLLSNARLIRTTTQEKLTFLLASEMIVEVYVQTGNADVRGALVTDLDRSMLSCKKWRAGYKVVEDGLYCECIVQSIRLIKESLPHLFAN